MPDFTPRLTRRDLQLGPESFGYTLISGIADGSAKMLANGDFDKDGIKDILFSVPIGSEKDAGSIYIIIGAKVEFKFDITLSDYDPPPPPPPDGRMAAEAEADPPALAGFRIDGVDAYDQAGRSIAWAGDVNGDGFDDIVIGVGYDAGLTQSYVVFGSATLPQTGFSLAGLDGSNGFRIDGAMAGDGLGLAVGGGDVNGDGFADLILGAPLADADGDHYSGSTYILFGSDDPFAANVDLGSLNGANGFRIDGIDPNDRSGIFVATGDINGDGITDIVIGASGGDRAPFPNDNAGETYVVFGSRDPFAASSDLADLDGTNGFRIVGVSTGDGSGAAVASAGDVNGDGFADLLIGAPNANNDSPYYNMGAAYVVFGAAGGFAATIDLAALDGENGFRIDAEHRNDRLGNSVASAGDINGDGFFDIVVGAPNAGPVSAEYPYGDYTGSAYVVFGRAGGFGATFDPGTLDGSNGFRFDGTDPYDGAGSAVSGGGDVNGDGFDDVAVTAAGAGEGYIIFGRAPTTAVTRTGSAAGQTIRGGDFDDMLNGLGGNDILDGGLGHDRLYGSFGRDTLGGGGGDDLLNGGAEIDTMRGAAGNDHYIVQDAGDKTIEGADRGHDRVRAFVDHVLAANVEDLRLFGTAANGTGNELGNAIFGSSIANILSGLGGNDTLRGQSGVDTLRGGDDADILYGALGNDRLFGDAGADRLNGEAGIDTLLGGAGDDRLFGMGGADKLNGGAGDDALNGGIQRDTMTGGANADQFVFDDGDTAATRNGADIVTDFNRAEGDRINLRQVDANADVGGDQNFTFVGDAAFSGAAGELRYAHAQGNTYIEGDTNGDGSADFMIRLDGMHVVDAADFVV